MCVYLPAPDEDGALPLADFLKDSRVINWYSTRAFLTEEHFNKDV